MLLGLIPTVQDFYDRVGLYEVVVKPSYDLNAIAAKLNWRGPHELLDAAILRLRSHPKGHFHEDALLFDVGRGVYDGTQPSAGG